MDTTTVGTTTSATETGADVSGPCDEAEHANDPRCQGGSVRDDDAQWPARRAEREADDDRCGAEPRLRRPTTTTTTTRRNGR